MDHHIRNSIIQGSEAVVRIANALEIIAESVRNKDDETSEAPNIFEVLRSLSVDLEIISIEYQKRS